MTFPMLRKSIVMEKTGELREFRKSVRIYHALPTFIVLVVVAVFLGFFHLTGSYLVSGIAAVLPALSLLWRWSVAARLVDRCPLCGEDLKGKFSWSYPPTNCPHCEASLR